MLDPAQIAALVMPGRPTGGGSTLWANLAGTGQFDIDSIIADINAAHASGTSKSWGTFVAFSRTNTVGTSTLFGCARSAAANGFQQWYANASSNDLLTLVKDSGGTNQHFDTSWTSVLTGADDWLLINVEYNASLRHEVTVYTSGGSHGTSGDTYIGVSHWDSAMDQATLGGLRRNGGVNNPHDGFLYGGCYWSGGLASGSAITQLGTDWAEADMKTRIETMLATLEGDLGSSVKFSQPFYQGASARVGTDATEVGTISWEEL